jgi:hypothetical protein
MGATTTGKMVGDIVIAAQTQKRQLPLLAMVLFTTLTALRHGQLVLRQSIGDSQAMRLILIVTATE